MGYSTQATEQATRWADLGQCVHTREGKGKAGRMAAIGPRSISRPRKRKREAWASSRVGLDRRKKKVFKRTLISIFRALKLGQIEMEFEFNLKQLSPTLNQKQYASA